MMSRAQSSPTLKLLDAPLHLPQLLLHPTTTTTTTTTNAGVNVRPLFNTSSNALRLENNQIR